MINDDNQHCIPSHATPDMRHVTDFNFTIDLAPYICQQWSRITIKGGRYVPLRDLLEQYALSRREIKQIDLHPRMYGWFEKDIRNRILTLLFDQLDTTELLMW